MTEVNATRREVLAGMCILAAATLTACSTPTPEESAAGIRTRDDGKVEVTIAELSGLAADGNSVLIGAVGSVGAAALVRVTADSYKAFNLACTHEGEQVSTNTIPWTCPAHGAQFDPLTGDVLRPPAFNPLEELSVSYANGVAVVG